MTNLKPMTAVSKPVTKDAFVATAGRQVLPSPKAGRTKKLSDPSARALKVLLFGGWGSGKTFAIVDLLILGYKMLVITTDVGGDGLNTVILECKWRGRNDVLDNVYSLVLNGDDEVQEFCREPAVFMPDFYEQDIDIIFWDGLSGWQGVDLLEKVGNMPIPRARGELPAAVEAGLQLEQAQWSMIKIGTIRTMDKFCAINNKKTGKVIHKIMTCQEGFKSKGQDAGGGFSETKMPMLQGAGGLMSGGAFDLIVRCKKVAGDPVTFMYQIEGDNLMSKNRGFHLERNMQADMGKLWGLMTEQLGIPRNAVDTAYITPLLIQQQETEVPSEDITIESVA